MDTKVCSKCGIEKDMQSFSIRSHATGKRNARCRACIALLDAKRWQDGLKIPTTQRARFLIRKTKEEFLWSILTTTPCKDCGTTNPLILSFDHIDNNKEYNVSEMVKNHSLVKIQLEVDKCEVVCHNCHSIRTQTRSPGWRMKKYMSLVGVKSGTEV